MKNKLRLLLCYLLICAIVPINLTFADNSIDLAEDGIHIDDIVYYLSQTGSVSNSELESLLDQIAPIIPTPTPTPTPTPSMTPEGVPVDYTFCGNENDICSFSGTAWVAYGAQNQYYYKTFTTSTPCNNQVFGDSNPGVGKACYYQIITPAPTDDSNASITYSGAWTFDNSSSDALANYNGTRHYSNETNAYSQYTFTGTSIKWIGEKDSNRGNADVYIDDTLVATIDTYNSSLLLQQVLYQNTGLSSGLHTIKVVVKGTKNASSSDYHLSIDAFEYNSSL